MTQGAAPGRFAHAFANPPWHDPAGTRPADARRALATHGAGLEAWVTSLTAVAVASVTLALPAAQVGTATALLARADFGRQGILLLRPKAGRPAKVALVHARPGAAEPAQTDDLVLHEADGRFTPAAEAVLRDGAALPITYRPG